jgi:hypothetical protein
MGCGFIVGFVKSAPLTISLAINLANIIAGIGLSKNHAGQANE